MISSLRPDDLYKSPRTRNSGVTCLSFGENRKAQYPGYFFCHNCDKFEDAIRNGSKRAKWTQSRYVYTAGHEAVDSGNPTTLCKHYQPANNVVMRQDKAQEVVTIAASPTAVKIAVKKKIRRSRRSRPHGDDDDSHGSNDKYSEEQDGDEMNRKFASA